MGFPRKWKHLIEKDPIVVVPDYVVLTYSVLPADDKCICPRCGRSLFRTGVLYYMDRARNQKDRTIWHRNYKTVPITWSD